MRDWHAWHREYDDPASSLSRRLEVVRHELGRSLTWLETEGVRRPHVVSMCAGDGRDVLPVLAGGHPSATAVLVELDAALADRAVEDAAALGLTGVEVRVADAGTTRSYAGGAPADVLLACGVFGNVDAADVTRTVAALPHLLASNAVVIWTRGTRAPQDDPENASADPSELVRSAFLDSGFCEVTYVRPEDASYRVGVARFTGEPQPYDDDLRMFTFV